MHPPIPESSHLDIGALSRIFRHKTNSYKYLFFLSLLHLLKDRDFIADKSVPFDDLLRSMLLTAWYPHRLFRLSFGLQDQIPGHLDRMNVPDELVHITPATQTRLRQFFAHFPVDVSLRDLLRYVPYRLLRAFFAEETRGLSDARVNARLPQLASMHFATHHPLYCFVGEDAQAILLHPAWVQYLRENFAIVLAWASWNWAEYMQARNPSVPAVAQKLFPPQQRNSLASQRQFWQSAMARAEIRCIYSGKLLNAAEDVFALDHFLPWTFVVHDQLWNLVPSHPEANSSKGDRLPSEKYLDSLVEIQHRGLSANRAAMEEHKWLKCVEPYLLDLKVEPAHLLDHRKLRRAYKNTLLPLLSIATAQGFPSNWTYKSASLYSGTTDRGDTHYEAQSSTHGERLVLPARGSDWLPQ